MIATIMSTLNTTTFLSAVTIGNDIIWKLRRDKGDIKKVNTYTRIGLVITAVTSFLFAIYAPSVVDMWYIVGTIAVPGLLIPVLTTYFDKLTPGSGLAFITMLSGFSFSLLSFIVGHIFKLPDGTPRYPFGLEPMFPGLIVSILVYMLGRRWEK
jgi:SSS family solute:Na+ symporter